MDARSACLGRLLLRLLIHKELHIPHTSISFGRTKEGKPYLVIRYHIIQYADNILGE